jgi:hypothetical protein
MLPETETQVDVTGSQNKVVAWLDKIREQIKEDALNPTRLPDRYKAAIGYFRHLATLSTGSIFLQMFLLEKVFAHPKWKLLIAVSLVSFTLCIVGAVVAQTFALTRSTAIRRSVSLWRFSIARLIVESLSVGTTWVAFLLGVVALTTFALRNLYSP